MGGGERRDAKGEFTIPHPGDRLMKRSRSLRGESDNGAGKKRAVADDEREESVAEALLRDLTTTSRAATTSPARRVDLYTLKTAFSAAKEIGTAIAVRRQTSSSHVDTVTSRKFFELTEMLQVFPEWSEPILRHIVLPFPDCFATIENTPQERLALAGALHNVVRYCSSDRETLKEVDFSFAIHLWATLADVRNDTSTNHDDIVALHLCHEAMVELGIAAHRREEEMTTTEEEAHATTSWFRRSRAKAFDVNRAIFARRISFSSFGDFVDDEGDESKNDTVNIAGLELVCPRTSLPPFPTASHHVMLTPTVLSNLRLMAAALATTPSHSPLLLSGESGSGKTSAVREIARKLRVRLVEIQVDDELESKTLVGGLSPTQVPGEFRWRAGALTKAMVQGCWVLVEDVGRVPLEVFAALDPLFKTGRLCVNSRGDLVSPAPSFRIFFTTTTPPSNSSANNTNATTSSMPHSKFTGSWTRVEFASLPRDEVEEMAHSRFAARVRRCIVRRIVDSVFAMREDETLSATFRRECGGGRSLGPRDVYKWLERVSTITMASNPLNAHSASSSSSSFSESGLGASINASNGDNSEFITEREKEAVLTEALDLFVAPLPHPAARLRFCSFLSLRWGLPETRMQEALETRRAQLVMDAKMATIRVGRVTLALLSPSPDDTSSTPHAPKFAPTSVATRLLERLAACDACKEPVLLVGETGTGKTSVVQHLARVLGKRLVVQNMHVQADAGELIGGFKPLDLGREARRLHDDFLEAFGEAFELASNGEFLGAVTGAMKERKWKKLCKAVKSACVRFFSSLTNSETGEASAKRRRSDAEPRWRDIMARVEKLERLERIGGGGETGGKSAGAFAFVEGALVKSIERGDWVLLDEINLASSETLERLAPVLEGPEGSLVITERGDLEPIRRHPDFRLIGAMNPSTDFGKKDLPPSLRARFTEIYVEEVTEEADARLVVGQYLEDGEAWVEPAVRAFLACRRLATEAVLLDGAGQSPRYSLRTLVRSLRTARRLVSHNGFPLSRALYDGFLASFVTPLDSLSAKTVEAALRSIIFAEEIELRRSSRGTKGKDVEEILTKVHALPRDLQQQQQQSYVLCGDFYWLPRCSSPTLAESDDDGGNTSNDTFIITPSVKANLIALARAVCAARYPILLQGPTSAGKTSMVGHLARLTGRRLVRINNHEHTDLQEYLGSYVSEPATGRLVFREGALATAVRRGDWIVLDELNLAPTEVLEALNRLLDDNRELFIAETQTVLKAHPDFMLFATQNPPGGAYGGRKQLSRAFRNRFMEINVEEIPAGELETIVHRRSRLPESFCKCMVGSMKELQAIRSQTRLFAGKGGLVTPRDLLRWADRGPTSYAELARDGFRVLGERLRSEREREAVRAVILRHCRVASSSSEVILLERETPVPPEAGVVWTQTMRRLFTLVQACVRSPHPEPVLVVGETGGGKTTAIQALARSEGKRLVIVNLHQNTETADLLGGLRPRGGGATASGDGDDDNKALFEWRDGPLAEAMRRGDYLLLDEISLAEDAVLERLNSVLEHERTLVLAERPVEEGGVAETVVAHPDFRLFATMNPGGDFGKKELSPALRNRFTEIWVPPAMEDREGLMEIVKREEGASEIPVEAMVDFARWFNERAPHQLARLSLRDLIAWARFAGRFGVREGAELVVLDGLGVGTGAAGRALEEFRGECHRKLCELLLEGSEMTSIISPPIHRFEYLTRDDGVEYFGAVPYLLPLGPHLNHRDSPPPFSFKAGAPSRNAYRLMRAMHAGRAVLLEGSPGVGKTSLVSAVAETCRRKLLRINLSEETDFADLVGAFLPTDDPLARFAWSDGVFLAALKSGDWVLLDELNLASQSVLEGLNAVLDHRAGVFVPELNRTFACHPEFRVFAAQNPLQEGGGRRGLPKSFLNRFTRVFAEPMAKEDILEVARAVHVSLEDTGLKAVVEVNDAMARAADRGALGRAGGPWEFNLRDVARWCAFVGKESQGEAWEKAATTSSSFRLGFDILYRSRFRTLEARAAVDAALPFPVPRVPGVNVRCAPAHVSFDEEKLITIRRGPSASAVIHAERDACFPSALLAPLRNVAACVSQGWPVCLVGARGSGKSRLLHHLAQLCGRELVEIPLSSSTDAGDLLGSFEQAEAESARRGAISDIVRALRSRDDEGGANVFSEERVVLARRLERMMEKRTLMEEESVADATTTTEEEKRDVRRAIELLGTPCPVEASLVEEMIASSAPPLAKTKREEMRFEWVDGRLARAVERGEWVVLENANLCSPAVLDRLNPLLEPGGWLMINERGLDREGRPRVLRSHPDFRVFLTCDPERGGEVSRAMRNRCVEICLLGEAGALERDAGHELMNEVTAFDARRTMEVMDMTRRFKAQGGGSTTLLSEWVHRTGDFARRSFRLMRGGGLSESVAEECALRLSFPGVARHPHQPVRSESSAVQTRIEEFDFLAFPDPRMRHRFQRSTRAILHLLFSLEMDERRDFSTVFDEVLDVVLGRRAVADEFGSRSRTERDAILDVWTGDTSSSSPITKLSLCLHLLLQLALRGTPDEAVGYVLSCLRDYAQPRSSLVTTLLGYLEEETKDPRRLHTPLQARLALTWRLLRLSSTPEHRKRVSSHRVSLLRRALRADELPDPTPLERFLGPAVEALVAFAVLLPPDEEQVARAVFDLLRASCRDGYDGATKWTTSSAHLEAAWRAVSKAVCGASTSSAATNTHLVNAMSALDRGMRTPWFSRYRDRGAVAPTVALRERRREFRKSGLVPSPPRVQRALEALLEEEEESHGGDGAGSLLDCLNRLDSESHRLSLLEGESERRERLEGVCTLRWSGRNNGGADTTEAASKLAELVGGVMRARKERARSRFLLVRSTLASQGSFPPPSKAPSITPTGSPTSRMTTDNQVSITTMTRNWAREKIAPILKLLALRAERVALIAATAITQRLIEHESTGDRIMRASRRRAIEAFISCALLSNARDATALAPYREFLWILDSLDAKTPSSSIDATSPEMLSLRVALSEMFVRYESARYLVAAEESAGEEEDDDTELVPSFIVTKEGERVVGPITAEDLEVCRFERAESRSRLRGRSARRTPLTLDQRLSAFLAEPDFRLADLDSRVTQLETVKRCLHLIVEGERAAGVGKSELVVPLEMVMREPSLRDDGRLNGAHVWITAGFNLLAVSTPASSLDPTNKARVRLDFAREELDVARSRRSALELLSRVEGVVESEKEWKEAEAAVAALEARVEELEKVRVARREGFAEMYEEMTRFLATACEEGAIRGILAENDQGRAISTVRTLGGFAVALLSRYGAAIPDVVMPFASGLFYLVRGLDLVKPVSSSSPHSLRTSTHALVRLARLPRALLETSEVVGGEMRREHRRLENENDGAEEGVSIVTSVHALLPYFRALDEERRKHEDSSSSSSSSSAVRLLGPALGESFRRLNVEWRRRRDEAEARRRENESVVKMVKARESRGEADEEEMAGIRRIFPSFHDEFEVREEGDVEDEGRAEEKLEGETKIDGITVRDLVEDFLEAFGGNRVKREMVAQNGIAGERRHASFARSYSRLHLMARREPDDDDVAASHLYALEMKLKELRLV